MSSTPLTNYQLAGDNEDLSPAVAILAQRKTPFLDKVLNQSKACTNTNHFWVNRKLTGFVDALAEAIGTSTSTPLVIKVDGSDSGIAVNYVAKTVLSVDDEYFQVTSVNTAVTPIELTCTRGFGGTTPATHLDNARVEIIGKPKPEGFIPSENEAEVGSRDSNITQIFQRTIKISYTAKNTRQVGMEGDIKDQTKNKITEMLYELEKAALYGRTSQDASGDNRTMAGLIEKVTNVNDASSNAISVDRLDTVIFNLLKVGASPDMILCSNDQKRKLNALQQSRFDKAQGQDTKKIQNVTDTYGAEHMDMPIVLCQNVRPGDIWILSSEHLQVVPLQSSAMQMEPLAKVGLLEQAQCYGEYTFEIKMPDTHYRIKNLATS